MVDFGVDGRRAAGAVSRDGERIGVEEEERAFRSFVVLYPVAVDEVTGWVTTCWVSHHGLPGCCCQGDYSLLAAQTGVAQRDGARHKELLHTACIGCAGISRAYGGTAAL